MNGLPRSPWSKWLIYDSINVPWRKPWFENTARHLLDSMGNRNCIHTHRLGILGVIIVKKNQTAVRNTICMAMFIYFVTSVIFKHVQFWTFSNTIIISNTEFFPRAVSHAFELDSCQRASNYEPWINTLVWTHLHSKSRQRSQTTNKVSGSSYVRHKLIKLWKI